MKFNDIFHISSLWYSMAGWKILELNPGEIDGLLANRCPKDLRMS